MRKEIVLDLVKDASERARWAVELPEEIVDAVSIRLAEYSFWGADASGGYPAVPYYLLGFDTGPYHPLSRVESLTSNSRVAGHALGLDAAPFCHKKFTAGNEHELVTRMSPHPLRKFVVTVELPPTPQKASAATSVSRPTAPSFTAMYLRLVVETA